jgi:succinate-semialdehyde dehydrogenase/glutarate-semialdehyde dehydrogenase
LTAETIDISANMASNKAPVDLKDPTLFITRGYINGEWVEKTSTGETFDVTNPANGTVIATIPEMGAEDVAAASRSAEAAFQLWRDVSPKIRGKIIRKWADLMLENTEDLGKILTLENGKPYAEAKGEIGFAAGYLEFYAGEAERLYGDIIPAANTRNRQFAIKQPIGPAACLVPWNFPAAMVTRKAGAALAAGCTVVLKPAGETPLTSLALAYLGEKAGIPKGVLNVITSLARLEEVGKALCEEPILRKLSFTGSTAIGKLLMQQCSGTLKKLSMELGGNSPFIIFDDCDVNAAVDALIGAKVRNSGQTCVCANRIYVQRGISETIAQALVERFRGLKTGDGFEEGVVVGPLTTSRGVKKTQSHVEDALSKGARLLHGGKPIIAADGKQGGNFFEPTVLADMSEQMLSFSEEIFGPVAALYPFDTESEVIALANKSEVGLGSYISTKDAARMWRVAEKLDVGMVGVNTGVIAAAELPFGGVKHSGFGTEGGKWGVDEFTVTKLIVLAVPDA